MPDIRRLVSISRADGTVTVVKDLEDDTSFFAARDSFQVIPPTRRPTLSARQRRYGGAHTVHEAHDNGAIRWRALIKGTTADNAIANAESMLTELERPRQDLFLEWRPDGATNSVYYEVRGPAEWTPTYNWAQFAGAKSWVTDVSIPVGPLARGPRAQLYTASSVVLPANLALTTALGGDAPGLLDVMVRLPAPQPSAAIFALIGWTSRPTTPQSGAVAPFGVIEAESAFSLWQFSLIGTDATYRGSNGVRVTTSAAASADAEWVIDPSTLTADDFAREIDVEVWARVEIDPGVISPKLIASLVPDAGQAYGAHIFTGEWGSAGRLLVKPTALAKRFVRLGTLSMPIDGIKWRLRVEATWTTGSTGVIGLDYVVLVPARARALSPTGKVNDSAYPKFIKTTNDTSKTIRGEDLSGWGAAAAGAQGVASGLGGSPIEVAPGNVDMVIKLSSLVPDDPTADATSELPSYTATTVTVYGWPRYWLARGA